MAAKGTWAEDYVDCFKGQAEGWPLYTPVKASMLKPGMCGYFDTDGHWKVLVDLSDPKGPESAKLPAIHGATFSQGTVASSKNWGLRKSTNVTRLENSAAVSGSDPHGMAGAGLSYTYEATSDKGAILLTRGAIQYEQADDNKPLASWAEWNGKELLMRSGNNPEGVWVITKTYSAMRRKIAILSGKGSTISIGIDAGALQNTQKLQASLDWWKQQSDDLWNTEEDEDGIVVAMCGIQWKTTKWFSSKAKLIVLRSQQSLDAVVDNFEIKPYEVVIGPAAERTGDDETRLDAVRVEPAIYGEVPGVVVGKDDSTA